MTRRWVAAAVVVAVALTVGHWLFWYGTRARIGAPSGATLPGRVFLDPELSLTAWLPYPHQNLAALERGLGDVERLLRSLAVLTGRPVPEMPSFGTRRVPPAHEIAVAVDETGERFVIAARVYPVAAQLARWAGRLADNPLLAGGRATLDGRQVEVTWAEGCWTLRPAGDPVPGTPRAGEAPANGSPDALAWLRLARSRGSVPAGEYRLARDGEDLILSGGDAALLERFGELRHRRPPMPLLLAESYRVRDRFAARALGLLPGARSIGGLPGAASVWLGPKRWRLPAEGVLDLVGDGPPKAKVGNWRVVALESESLARGEATIELTSALEAYPPLDVALWLEIAPAERLLVQVVEALEQVPVLGRREARRWRAAARVLEPLRGFESFTAFISREPVALSARLAAGGTGAGDRAADAERPGAEN